MADGARNGALVLLAVTVVVLVPLVGLGVRIWRDERHSGDQD